MTQKKTLAASRSFALHAARETTLFAFYLLLAIALTWPLASRLGTAVSDRGDPLLNAWIIDWVCHALTHAPLHLFDAPIFHPTGLALAFSEHMTGVALMVLPFHVAGAGAIAEHSLAMLLAFALSGYGAFVLARLVTRDLWASLTAGVFYAFVSFKFDHLSHVQVIASGWIPLTLAALIAFWRKGGAKEAAVFAAAFVMNGLSNIYWLLFTAVAVALTIVFLEATQWRAASAPSFPIPAVRRRRLLLALASAAVVLLPFLLPYQVVSTRYRMWRTSFESKAASATWADWFSPSPASVLYGSIGGGFPERHLFPGLLPLVLSAIAFTAIVRAMTAGGARSWLEERLSHARIRVLLGCAAALAIAGVLLVPMHKSDVPFTIAVACTLCCLPVSRVRNPLPWIGALWVAVGFIGSFGENSFLHSFLFRVLEPLRATRAPARWAIITYCGLAMLTAIGASRFRRGKRLLLVLAIIEVVPRIAWTHVPPEFPPVYHWIAAAKPSSIIELPISWSEREAGYVLASTTHRAPIMNGVSGFDPPLHKELSNHPYDDAMLDLLAANGNPVIVIHPDAAGRARGWLAGGRLAEIARFPDGDTAYRIRGPGSGPGRPAVETATAP